LLILIVDDDYTFRLRFAVPYPVYIDMLTGQYPFFPKHYMKQYHIQYNREADKLAKSEGYEFWWEAFQAHTDRNATAFDTNFPDLRAWVLSEVDPSGNRLYARNPYYWRVDIEGNQLPYIDYYDRIQLESVEVLQVETVAGKGDIHGWYLKVANFPLFKENEEKGGYRTILYPDARASEFGIAFNYTHKDPVLKEIYNDIRFRKAASHAVNRDEINELLYLGLAVPRQPLMDPGCSFWIDGIDKMFIEYDPGLANQLLDEMGLKWDADHEYRLRPDGKQLTIVLNYHAVMDVPELLKGYWKAIGIDLVLEPLGGQLYRERMQANEHDMGVWAIGGSSENYSRRAQPIRYRPPFHWPQNSPLGGTEWWAWYESNGERGEVPPQEVQRLYQVIDEWLAQPRGAERYIELGKEMLTINAENLWLIGTVGLMSRVAVVNAKLRNIPPETSILSVEYSVWAPYNPDTFYYGD
jgi:peptide/nickel transport system substrate-binding protein